MDIKNTIAYFKQVLPSEGNVDVEVPSDELPYCINFSDDIGVFFLNDAGDHYQMVQTKHLSEAGTSENELLQIGIENLRGVLQNIEITMNEGVLYFHGSGDFEASLLLVPELWEPGLSEHCPNGYVAAIPARDILVVCDKNDLDGIKKLSEVIEKIWPNGDHLLSNSLYTRDNGQWVVAKNA